MMVDTQHDSKRYLIGNWKCNKTISQAQEWFAQFLDMYQPDPQVQIIVAPPVMLLPQLADYLITQSVQGVSLAVQDISPFPPGSYTGSVAADMLKGIADFAIIGHSERRRYFHETSQDATNKVSEAADAGITPIICVEKAYAMSQLTSLLDIDCDRLIIAYSPVDALSYRAPEPVDMVSESIEYINQIFPNQPIVYGGAISADNSRHYVEVKKLSGLFVGSASLDPRSFHKIYQAISAVG